MLGPRLKYSSCWWAPEVADLAGAEDAMLELTCARAGLADGMRILELGCGWGSLTLWMAQRYPGARITAVSNSASQREFIERACRDRGLGNVTVHTGNVAEVDPGGPFDRIVSVEMFEHMRNWSALLTRMAGWLAPGGEVFLHVFCHHRWAYPFRTDRPGAWMARTFFTGGLMPAFDLPRRIPSPFAVTRAWAVDGRHYARTADAWRRNLEANRDAALEVLAWHHGRLGAERAYHRWRVFHMACQELFGAGDGRVWHVGHYRLAPTGVAA
ncbi:MAG: cyclopropane-fatty-acyl-phospholipid synthase family protein [Thermoleophilia bacterium]